MDQYSRRVLALQLTRRRTARETRQVLAQALARRRPRGDLSFYSDRGTESMGAAFGAFVAQHGMLQSASVRGPGDNAHTESFFHSLKAELTRRVTFLTERALSTALEVYIRYYNTRRMHSAPGDQSPIAFDRCAA